MVCKDCGDICYINEQAVMDSLDEELWGTNADKSDSRQQFDDAAQRLRNAEEFINDHGKKLSSSYLLQN